MDLGQQIGANLKQLRTERGLNLGQLSSLAGISKAMLSELEKGKANPTINPLWKIANGYKVSFTSLVEDQGEEMCIRDRIWRPKFFQKVS